MRFGLKTSIVAVSYDVNKDGLKVAVLTFTKSAYRLGETVLGVVELNERQGRSRVLSVSLSPPDVALAIVANRFP